MLKSRFAHLLSEVLKAIAMPPLSLSVFFSHSGFLAPSCLQTEIMWKVLN